MNGDEKALERQWQFLRILANRRLGVTLRELAAEATVTERTVRRDLEMFRRLGFPLEEQTAAFGRKTWRMQGLQIAALSFNLDEALAFYLGRRFLDPLAGTIPGEAAQRAFDKVRSCLSPGALQFLDRLADTFLLRTTGASDYRAQSSTLDELIHAIAEQRRTLLGYRSNRSTSPAIRQVDPYALAWHKGALYLFAHSLSHDALRTFKINRVTSAEATAERFHKPARFDLHEHLGSAFGIITGDEEQTVRLRFSPFVARYVHESQWHASQQLTPLADGAVEAEFRLSSVEEIHKWILSFGAHCEVLAPTSLRERLRDDARRMLAQYESPARDETPCSEAARDAAPIELPQGSFVIAGRRQTRNVR